MLHFITKSRQIVVAILNKNRKYVDVAMSSSVKGYGPATCDGYVNLCV